MEKRMAVTLSLVMMTLMVFSVLAPSVALAEPTALRHVVQAGDTLTAIAARYQTTVQVVMTANGLTGSVIYPGQSLIIPLDRGGSFARGGDLTSAAELCVHGDSYVLRQGDTLASLANRWGVALAAIKRANGLVSDVLWSGQTIKMVCASGDVVKSLAQDDSLPASSAGLCGGAYSVRPGDTLSLVAARCGVTVVELKNANGLVSNRLLVGQSLRIPARTQ